MVNWNILRTIFNLLQHWRKAVKIDLKCQSFGDGVQINIQIAVLRAIGCCFTRSSLNCSRDLFIANFNYNIM